MQSVDRMRLFQHGRQMDRSLHSIPAGRNNEIYLMNADGSNPARLTNNPGDDFAPSWSTDGTQIVFVSDATNQWVSMTCIS